ncbi:hypothetical protein KUV46_03500 [Thalassovita mediterranea]|nr:hypothetical protein KUV46_03500 [Thalassovita mediterranea]
MISREQIRLTHAHVPPVFWPVLWVYILRLWLTLVEAALEGRESVLYTVGRTGIIYVRHMADSEAERRARCPLGEDFDRTPWTRLLPIDLGELAELFRPQFRETPPLHPPCTASTPSLHHLAAPP